MTAVLEPATEHDCRCGASPARVWVPVADDAQPMCRACAHRAASDPVVLAGLAEAYREPVEDVLPLLRPKHGGAALAARVRRDPALRQMFVEIGQRVAGLRRRCRQCGLVTGAGPLAVHMRSTGHVGYEEVQA